jgi:hypothetical protein
MNAAGDDKRSGDQQRDERAMVGNDSSGGVRQRGFSVLVHDG